MEVETICRYDLPVCIVIFNNNGVYAAPTSNPTGGDVAPTVFVKGARYDKMIEAFGGVGVQRDDARRSCARRMDEAIALGQADAHQRRDRRDGRHRERPHHEPEPDRAAKKK